MSAVPSGESASTTMTWSISPVRSLSRATSARLGPIVAGREDQGGTELARRLAGSAQDGEVLVMKRSLLEPFPDVYRHVSCPFAQVAATSAQGSVVAFLAGRMPPA